MLHKTATVSVRIEPEIKAKAEAILGKVGLTEPEAVRLFYAQVCLHKGLPFEVKIPNKETVAAMQDANRRKTRKAKNADDLFKDLG